MRIGAAGGLRTDHLCDGSGELGARRHRQAASSAQLRGDGEPRHVRRGTGTLDVETGSELLHDKVAVAGWQLSVPAMVFALRERGRMCQVVDTGTVRGSSLACSGTPRDPGPRTNAFQRHGVARADLWAGPSSGTLAWLKAHWKQRSNKTY